MNPGSSAPLGSQLRRWWDSLNDDDKQAALDTFGELAGGTVGALSGSGVASIPAAGAGAVVGKGAARGVGRAIGLKPTPQSAGEVTKDIAGTFATNAAGEGIGRAIQPAYRGVKSLAKRAAQIAVRPNMEVAALAAKANVPLTVGMVSDSPTAKIIESGLEKYPGSTGVIRDARKETYGAWDRSVHKAGEKLGPRMDDEQVGQALKDSFEANHGPRKQAYFGPKFDEVESLAGQNVLDMTQARDASRQLLSNITPDTARFFPSTTLARLRQIARMGVESVKEEAAPTLLDAYGRKAASTATPKPKSYIDSPEGLRDIDQLPEMTFGEAKALRTQLLEANRALTKSGAAFDRKAIPSLLSGVDASIDESLSAINPDALNKWRAANAEYRPVMNKLNTKGAQKIDKMGADTPESLPALLSKQPSRISQTEAAVSPSTIPGGKGDGPMPAFRRNRFDDLVDRSRTQDRWVGDDTYLNPRTLERNAGKLPTEKLFGGQVNADLKDSIKLGKAATSPEWQYGNSSGTGRTNLILSGMAGLGSTVLPGDSGLGDRATRATAIAGGLYFGPKYAAKALTSPRVMRALTTAPPALTSPMGSPLLGAAGRSIMGMGTMPESKGSSDLPADFLADSPAGDLPADFIDQDATARLKRTPPALSAPR